jgi:DNA-binding transcriptional MerR regulator
MLTIGELADQFGLRTSTLRYYEQRELLVPAGRSDAGYRLYDSAAIDRLQLIRRAQQLGFSLDDIHILLNGWERGDLSRQEVIETAERRYMALESQLTELLILRHELRHFLQDLHAQTAAPDIPSSMFEQLVNRVCHTPTDRAPASMLDWLVEAAGCVLTSDAAHAILERLRGQHVHIWEEEDAYHILVVSQEPEVLAALQELAELEEGCQAHPTPELHTEEDGFLFVARGPNAFIFARLFMALESQSNSS